MTLRATVERVRAAFAATPPTADEVAAAPLVGGLASALVNAVAIGVVLGRPQHLATRLLHHAFDFVETLAVAGWLALLPALYLRLARRGRSEVPAGRASSTGARLLPGVLVVAASCAGMQWVLGDHLRRQADAVLEGRLALFLRPFMLLGCGLGVLAALLVGWCADRVGGAVRRLVAFGGFAALVAHHAVIRDDYPNIHAAIAWIAATLLGATYARQFVGWLRRHRSAFATLAALVVLGTALPPPNAVRLALFQECGSVASWVLARSVWRLPEVAPEEVARATAALSPPGGAPAPPPPSRPVPAPVVVLLTVDALRADVLAEPAHEARLPNLTRLKKAGFHAARAVSGGSQTAVSLAAMFSGRTFSGQRWTLHGEGVSRFLYPATDAAVRFPELLSQAGVRTEGFFALRFLTGDFGITRGFASEQLLTVGRKHAPANAVLEPMLAALDRLRPDEPAFFFAHLTEPHEPYDRGKLRQGTSFERYLSEIEVVDGWIGRLVARLGQRAKGRGFLLLGADHGEAFGEHRTEFHTKTIYEELVRVPLVVWGPGVRARRCDEPFALADVGPTVLELFGLPASADGLGESLLPFARGERGCAERRAPIVTEGRLRRAYYAPDGLKVIEDHVHKTVEVFDLTADPGELRPLSLDEPRARAALAGLRSVFAARALPGYEPPYKP